MNKRAKSNTIRIISGRWKGRKIKVLDAQGLRPTTDRMRETLFNWLMFDVQGARCLDLFAGSGVLGLECLSRGAEFVQFVEINQNSASSLQQTLNGFSANISLADVRNASFETVLAAPPEKPYDLVFIDPPFKANYLVSVVQSLAQTGWLADNAMVYLEQSSASQEVGVPPNWIECKRKKAGLSLSLLYRVESPN